MDKDMICMVAYDAALDTLMAQETFDREGLADAISKAVAAAFEEFSTQQQT